MSNVYVVMAHRTEGVTYHIKSGAFSNYKAAKEYYDDMVRRYANDVKNRPNVYRSCWNSDKHHFTIAYHSNAQLDIILMPMELYTDSGLNNIV